MLLGRHCIYNSRFGVRATQMMYPHTTRVYFRWGDTSAKTYLVIRIELIGIRRVRVYLINVGLFTIRKIKLYVMKVGVKGTATARVDQTYRSSPLYSPFTPTLSFTINLYPYPNPNPYPR